MTSRRKLAIIVLCTFLMVAPVLPLPQLQAQLNSWHAAVQLEARRVAPTTIELRWDATVKPEGTMRIWRRQPVSSGSQIYLGETSSAAGVYVVNNVDPAEVVEFTVQRSFLNGEAEVNGVGYITVAHELEESEHRGILILIVDFTVGIDLEQEIDQLRSDLTGDGWVVIREDVARDAEVTQVRKLIQDIYAEYPDDTKAVYLLGHVPVPYSGHTRPDGHIEHLGAWPADGYYADIDGIWTDQFINQDSSARDANDNLIGDGKFDQSNFLGDLELALGRVDFANMPAFEKNEVELLRQYLNRAHDWRHKKFTVQSRALIDDNFGFFSGEAFASSAFRSIATLVGRENIFNNIEDATLNYMTTLKEDDYLWSYGCGGGTYRSANGIGNTNDFATGELKTVFTMLFGSYFGDWDVSNSFLRAPLAADGYCLMNVWSGRPHWHMHFLALGATTGEATLLSQNNGSPVRASYIALANWRGVTMALMGDPAIRMHVAAPVTDLGISTANDYVDLTWSAPAEEIVSHYNVYRSLSPRGPFERINPEVVTGLEYSDPHAADGVNYYMVRAAVLQNSPSGSYYNLSQGVFADIEFERVSTSVADASELLDFRIGPVPARNFVNVEFAVETAESLGIRLLDVRGALVYSRDMGTVNGTFSTQLPLQNLPPGMYILELQLGEVTYQSRVMRYE